MTENAAQSVALCQCGCGLPAPIAAKKSARRGWVKGQVLACRIGHSSRLRPNKGTSYRFVVLPEHPSATKRGRILEHVLIVEGALGRQLRDDEQVHHVDENIKNNANRNLVACQDTAYHQLLHVRTRVVRTGGDPNTQRQCFKCKRLLPFEAFHRSRSDKATGRVTTCRECRRPEVRK